MNLNLHRFSEQLWLWMQRLRRSRPVSRVLDHPRVRRILDDPEFQISCEIAAPTLAVLILVLAVLVSACIGIRHYRCSREYQEAAVCYAEGDYLNALLSVEAAQDIKETARAYLLEAEIYMGLDQLDHAIHTLYAAVVETNGDAAVKVRLEELKSLRATMHAGLQTSGERWIAVGDETVDLYRISLDLSDRALTDDHTAGLDAMVYLSALDLSGNQMSDLKPLSRLVSLRTLNLSDNNLSDLSDLSHLRSLRSLSLDGCTAADFSPLYHLKSLTHLSLHGVSMTSKQLDALQDALPNCEISYDSDCVRPVKTLRLGGMTFDSDIEVLDLSDRNLTTIRVLSECSNLKYLDLRGNHISDLSPLQNLTELQWLCLWDNQISDLSPLEELDQLTYLDLESNTVADIGSLCELDALQELWLNGNPIADFTPLCELQQLTRLGLRNVGLTDETLNSLLTLNALMELDVTGNSALTGVQAFQDACPDCVVIDEQPQLIFYCINGILPTLPVIPQEPGGELDAAPTPQEPDVEAPDMPLPDSVTPEQVQPMLPSVWMQWLEWLEFWMRDYIPPELWENWLPFDPMPYPVPEEAGDSAESDSTDSPDALPELWEEPNAPLPEQSGEPENAVQKIPGTPQQMTADAAGTGI